MEQERNHKLYLEHKPQFEKMHKEYIQAKINHLLTEDYCILDLEEKCKLLI